LGGLSKKVFQINSLSDADTSNRLLLDSGNLLFKRASIGDGLGQKKLTAESIIEIYQEIGYDAVGIGPLDLAAGVDFIQKSKGKGFPWISCNITDTAGTPLFKPWTNKNLGNINIVITAITAVPQKKFGDIIIQPWRKSLSDTIGKIKEENDDAFIILLSSLSNDNNQQITELFPDINLLIGADPRKGNISPHISENCLLVQTAKQGKYQGLLEIIFGKERIWGQDNGKLLADLQNKMGSINWQLRRLQKKDAVAVNKDKYKNTILRLQKEKDDLNSKIAASKEILAQEKITGAMNDRYIYRFIGLKKNMPNDQPTAEKLLLLNHKIKDLHQKEKRNKKVSKNISMLTENMVGHAVCETCHETQASFWKTTGHASAYTTLLEKNKALDLDCLPCHLSLNTSKHDFQIRFDKSYLAYPPLLRSVGCESCHGPGKSHSIAPEDFKVSRHPQERVCLTCHTPEHDDKFEYASKLNRITCPSE